MQKESDKIGKTSALLLAAGYSSRMGSPKFLLRNNKSITFIESLANAYRDFGCGQIVLVINEIGYQALLKSSVQLDFVDIAINQKPELERFYSIQCGLKKLKHNVHVFIHPIDNQCTDKNVFNELWKSRRMGDYQVPVFMGKGGHPVLISHNIVNEVLNYKNIEINLKSFLNLFVKKTVDVQNVDILLNINTLDDYQFFLDRQV